MVAPATPTPVDGAALLQQAVAATAAGYHFNQTATVDSTVALTIDGDRLPERCKAGGQQRRRVGVLRHHPRWHVADAAERRMGSRRLAATRC